MIIDKILFSPTQPGRTDVAWARPVQGGFALYMHFNGSWQPLRVMKTQGSRTPDDDQPYDLDAIGASQLADLDDVSLDNIEAGQILKYNGTIWENEDDDSGTPGPDTVGSEQIIDNSVELADLNDSVKDKINKTYDASDESLSMQFDVVP
jgi:hypothetical protein